MTAEKVSFPFHAFLSSLSSTPLLPSPLLHPLPQFPFLSSLLIFFISFLLRPNLKCQIRVKHDKYRSGQQGGNRHESTKVSCTSPCIVDAIYLFILERSEIAI